MNQIMHLIIGSILFNIMWHLVLKKTWPMKEKINEIGDNINKFF